MTPTATDAAAPGDAAAGHTQQSAHAALALVAAARAEADVIVNAIAALSSSTPSLALAPIAPRRATLASLAASRAGAVGGRLRDLGRAAARLRSAARALRAAAASEAGLYADVAALAAAGWPLLPAPPGAPFPFQVSLAAEGGPADSPVGLALDEDTTPGTSRLAAADPASPTGVASGAAALHALLLVRSRRAAWRAAACLVDAEAGAAAAWKGGGSGDSAAAAPTTPLTRGRPAAPAAHSVAGELVGAAQAAVAGLLGEGGKEAAIPPPPPAAARLAPLILAGTAVAAREASTARGAGAAAPAEQYADILGPVSAAARALRARGAAHAGAAATAAAAGALPPAWARTGTPTRSASHLFLPGACCTTMVVEGSASVHVSAVARGYGPAAAARDAGGVSSPDETGALVGGVGVALGGR